MRYILNSAVIAEEGIYEYRKITLEDAKLWLQSGKICSAIGYEETASAIFSLTGYKPEVNRVEVRMREGDEALVFRLTKRVKDPEQKGELSKEYVLSNYEFGILKRIK
jgi:hypothetical protein